MTISIIVAIAENHVIGSGNSLIWHLPEDLKNFKRLTSSHTILMGRKTYESIGRPLPNRTNVILTRDESYTAEGCIIVNDIADALERIKLEKETELFIIGGGEIYKQTISIVDKLYLTKVNASFEGDTYFPEIEFDKWNLLSKKEFRRDEKHQYDFSIMELEKIKKD